MKKIAKLENCFCRKPFFAEKLAKQRLRQMYARALCLSAKKLEKGSKTKRDK
jgi:hypothetical protein